MAFDEHTCNRLCVLLIGMFTKAIVFRSIEILLRDFPKDPLETHLKALIET